MGTDTRELVERFAGVRVLVVGDAMLDRYIVGSVERISPEAPVPVLLVENEFDRMGGAANVAGNVAALGGQAHLLSLVGRNRRSDPGEEGDEIIVPRSGNDFMRISDPEATRLAWRCVAANIRTEFLPLLPCTIVKTRLIAGRQQVVRFDRENIVGRTTDEANRAAAAGHPFGPAPLDADSRQARRIGLEPLLAECDVILVSDYAKGMVDAELMTMLRESGLPVVVDPRPSNAMHYRGVHLMTPNRREAMEMIGNDPRITIPPRQLAEAVAERYATRALVTLGAQGMCLAGAEFTSPVHLHAKEREVFDVTGAGDTVAAVMALSIGAGIPLTDAAAIANVAAQWTVGRIGTVCITPPELIAELALDAEMQGG